jgi:hypothetical protein
MGPDSPTKDATAAADQKCLNGGACCAARTASEAVVKLPARDVKMPTETASAK